MHYSVARSVASAKSSRSQLTITAAVIVAIRTQSMLSRLSGLLPSHGPSRAIEQARPLTRTALTWGGSYQTSDVVKRSHPAVVRGSVRAGGWTAGSVFWARFVGSDGKVPR